jgi:DMSO/TMAO reductase YedYZ molybdopterin-dependent catalytic subunit
MADQTTKLPSFGPPGPVRQILRQREPLNSEFPFAELSQFITPSDQFYVRSHFPTPSVDLKSWRLSIEGAVRKPVSFSLDELKQLPAQTRMVTLECAGNARMYLMPKAAGVQWDLGAVSNAEWTGVILSELLDRAGVRAEAVEIILEGADEGTPDEPPKPPGKIRYARSIPLSKVPDVLLAYEMNGEPLPASHGAPLRAVVGGWFGMASVKWLSRIVAATQPFLGYFQTTDYAYWQDDAGQPVRVPITEMKTKAQIARPAPGEIIARNSHYRIVGAAWSGDSDLSKVEISTDAGAHFTEAKLLGPAVRHAWRLWEFDWQTPISPGPVTLFARARDAKGATQPMARDPKYGTYVIFHVLPMEVIVE